MSEPTSPLAPEVSPLLEADPNSINTFIQERVDKIFNKPPLLLSDEDLKVAVEYYRNERVRFAKESLNKESKPRVKAGTKAPKSVKEALASIEDLI